MASLALLQLSAAAMGAVQLPRPPAGASHLGALILPRTPDPSMRYLPSSSPLHKTHQRTPHTYMTQSSTPPRPVLLGLAAFGALVGPLVDAVHNQALLSYDVLPVVLGPVHTSSLIPLLLSPTYVLLGGVIPAALTAFFPRSSKPLFSPRIGLGIVPNTLFAVSTTVGIIKASELLLASGASQLLATGVLYGACILQWALVDASPISAAFALVVSVAGPVAELPFTWLGLWHYLPNVQDYWPLSFIGADSTSGQLWAGLAHITGPCYFAVCTDAIALGRCFDILNARKER